MTQTPWSLALAPSIVERFGGPGRDRTDDLFHAMEFAKSYLADVKDFKSRTSRQKPQKSTCFDTKSDTKLGRADSGGSALFFSSRLVDRTITINDRAPIVAVRSREADSDQYSVLRKGVLAENACRTADIYDDLVHHPQLMIAGNGLQMPPAFTVNIASPRSLACLNHVEYGNVPRVAGECVSALNPVVEHQHPSCSKSLEDLGQRFVGQTSIPPNHGH